MIFDPYIFVGNEPTYYYTSTNILYSSIAYFLEIALNGLQFHVSDKGPEGCQMTARTTPQTCYMPGYSASRFRLPKSAC